MIVTLTGMMGCGKSTVGRRLASVLGWNYTDLDQYIVREEGMSIPEIFSLGGESLFRDIEYRCLIQVLQKNASGNLVLSLGGGTLTVEKSREAVASYTVCIYLKTSLEELEKRLRGNEGERPMLSGNRIAELLARREPEYEKTACHTIMTDGRSIDALAKRIAGMITSHPLPQQNPSSQV
ncbi:MAG: shikimate kinase [Candidatus Cryptobacteroides sp.]